MSVALLKALLARLPSVKLETIKELLAELPGVVGFGLVASGVYMLWGVAWTCLVAGAVLVVAYLTREIVLAIRGLKRGGMRG